MYFIFQICPQKFGRQDHLGRHVLKAHSSDKNDSSPFVVAKQTKSPAKKQASHEMVAGKTPTTMDSKVCKTLPELEAPSLNKLKIENMSIQDKGNISFVKLKTRHKEKFQFLC